ncbi:MAG: hypothetical protein MUD12_15095 [Spirochaetes bacterium]|nr:hypothetical protein [Spirochaetota bacterium]
MLSVIGTVFGAVGGIAAFLNAYEGYQHFPAITRKRRIIMSLEIAALGFLMTVGAVILVFFLVGKIFI